MLKSKNPQPTGSAENRAAAAMLAAFVYIVVTLFIGLAVTFAYDATLFRGNISNQELTIPLIFVNGAAFRVMQKLAWRETLSPGHTLSPVTIAVGLIVFFLLYGGVIFWTFIPIISFLRLTLPIATLVSR